MKNAWFVLMVCFLFVSLNGCSAHYYTRFTVDDDYPATTTVYTAYPTYYRYPNYSTHTANTHSITVKGDGYSYYRLDQSSSGTGGGYYNNYDYGYPGGYSNSNVVINEYYDLEKYNGGTIGYGNPIANNSRNRTEQRKSESKRSVGRQYNGYDEAIADNGNNNIARSKSDYVSIKGRGTGSQEPSNITPNIAEETRRTTPTQQQVPNIPATTADNTGNMPSLTQLFNDRDKNKQNETPKEEAKANNGGNSSAKEQAVRRDDNTSKAQKKDKSGDRSTQRERINKR